MHIPDGYLSPQTWVPLTAIAVPILALAARKVKANLRSRQVPFLALGASFSFVIMMFNIPTPGGTTDMWWVRWSRPSCWVRGPPVWR